MTTDRQYTTASELAEYVYCRRAWWLHRIEGSEPHNRRALSRGSAAHSRHGLRVSLAGWLVRSGQLLLLLGAILVALLWLSG